MPQIDNPFQTTPPHARKPKEKATDVWRQWAYQDFVRALYGPQDGPVKNTKLRESAHEERTDKP